MSNDTELLDAVVMPRRLSYGQYVGAQGQPAFDWEKCMAEISASHYNAISVHLLSPWSNYDGFYPWTFNHSSDEFDLTGPLNQAWLNHLEEMLVAAWKPRPTKPVSVELCFFDIYFTDQWKSSFPKYGSIYHPFRDNNIGLHWGGSALPLYDAMGRGNVPSPWLSWTGDKGPFAVHGAIGHALERYIDGVATVAAKVAALYPNRHSLWIRFANEQYARVDRETGDIDYAHHMGGYDQILYWMLQKFKAAGVHHLTPVTDWFPTYDMRTPALDMMRRSAAAVRAYCGAAYEIHNVGTGAEVQMYLDAGLNRNWTLFSSDGEKEDPTYPDRMKQMIDKGVSVDTKAANYFGAPPFNRDTNKSFAVLFPKTEKDIFG